jgi:HK97 family phage portal protein
VGLISWLASKLGTPVPVNSIDFDIDEYMSAVGDIYVREMAFWAATNLIANAISKCEFKTYENFKEVRKDNYYRWNVEPNRNQNSSAFIHKLIAKLYRNNEVLIVEHGEDLLVADDFTRKEYALYDNEFTQVTVGDFTFSKKFYQNEVMYLQLSEKNTRELISGLYESYAKLIDYTMKSYQRSRGTKAKFEYKTIPTAGTEQRKLFDDLINEKFKKFLESDNAIVPIGEGQNLTEFSNSKTYSNEGTRDIRAMIDDVFAFTARAFGIPPALMSGEIEGVKDALDQFLTFCIDPLADMIQEEINRKTYTRAQFLRGDYVQIDTKQIKHIDIFYASTSIDKLISSGVFCVNDILKMLGLPIIDEDWAWEHVLTKNYSPFENLLKALEGGESE